ncbi:MAG: ribosome maturation factor RimP [Eubacteriales bacterium]|nr:ribosome maturation factor RimP [Eubacteriales bacterium]
MKGKQSGRSARQKIEENTERLAAPIAESFGIYIYDVEYVREGQEEYLNVYIDKEGGVTINDCEAVSRKLSDALDEENLITDPYTLVVSSPGLGRALTKDRHLRQSIGQDVEIHLYKADPETGEKDLCGELLSFDEKRIVIAADPPVSNSRRGGTGKKSKKGKKQAVREERAPGEDESAVSVSAGSAAAGSAEKDPVPMIREDGRMEIILERSAIASVRLAFYD